ncbi:uncharacterized protein [Spinacia oleracea]|uniref:NAC domain-containing protein n=1 Tax=Spinacia oleracea TaxID=3562 RepID=A0A9R0I0N2_SPIOL|nr:uncharacterized protein LOC110780402 [Spinacia oleracea]
MSNARLLPGFHFKPTELQLLNFYLLPKINDEPLPVIPRMLDANIYGEKGDHPSQVFDSFGSSDREEEDTIRYFFTKLQHVSKKNGVKSKNVIRSVGGYGYWNNNGKIESIKVKNNNQGQGVDEYVEVGSKTSLTFKRGKDIADDHVEWSMIEISTDYSNVVLCKITKKIKKRHLQTISSSIISTTTSAITTVADDGVQRNKRQCVAVQVYQPQEIGVLESGVLGMVQESGVLGMVQESGVLGMVQECGVLGMVQEQETNNNMVNVEQVNFEDLSVGGDDVYLSLEDLGIVNSDNNNTANIREEEGMRKEEEEEEEDDMSLFCKELEEDLSVGDDDVFQSLNSDNNFDGLLDLCSTNPSTTTVVADDDGVQGNKSQCVAVQVDHPQEYVIADDGVQGNKHQCVAVQVDQLQESGVLCPTNPSTTSDTTTVADIAVQVDHPQEYGVLRICQLVVRLANYQSILKII